MGDDSEYLSAGSVVGSDADRRPGAEYFIQNMYCISCTCLCGLVLPEA